MIPVHAISELKSNTKKEAYDASIVQHICRKERLEIWCHCVAIKLPRLGYNTSGSDRGGH